MSVIKDLVVDLEPFFEQYKSIKPYVVTGKKPKKEHIQLPEDRKKLDGLYECILCACCSTSCLYRFYNTYRFIVDSRDKNKKRKTETIK